MFIKALSFDSTNYMLCKFVLVKFGITFTRHSMFNVCRVSPIIFVIFKLQSIRANFIIEAVVSRNIDKTFYAIQRIYSNLEETWSWVWKRVCWLRAPVKRQPNEQDECINKNTRRRISAGGRVRSSQSDTTNTPTSSMRDQSTMKRERRDATSQKISTAPVCRLSPRVAFYQDIL